MAQRSCFRAVVCGHSSGFHKSFRAVVHLSPMQCVESMQLFRTQTLIREGTNVSKVGHLVGYNSPSQFSRELCWLLDSSAGFYEAMQADVIESPAWSGDGAGDRAHERVRAVVNRGFLSRIWPARQPRTRLQRFARGVSC